MAHCNVSRGKEQVNTENSKGKLSRKPKGFKVDIDSDIDQELKPFSTNAFISSNSCVSPSKSSDNFNSWWDLSPLSFCSRFRRQCPVFLENQQKNVKTFEGPEESIMYLRPVKALNSSMEKGNPDVSSFNQSLMSTVPNLHSLMESSVTKELDQEKNSIKQETVLQAQSISEFSDQIDDDDDGDQNVVERSGRRNQSKNIVAERKRRKKLKEKLYALRALVPKITKMDRASILGDAIEFIKELQNQVKELQNELGEEVLEEEGEMNMAKSGINNTQLQLPIQNAILKEEAKFEKNESLSLSKMEIKSSSRSKQAPGSTVADDNTQQMEMKVEVTQIDGNKFFLEVLCKHKHHGFVELMEAMDSLGLEVINANITTFRGHVLNVLRIEKGDDQTVEADQVKDLLLELFHNPIEGWSKHGNSMNYEHHHLQSLHFQS